MHTAVTADEMRGRLLTLDDVRERLSVTEPVASQIFPVGTGVRFRVQPAWEHGIDVKAPIDPVDASVTIGPVGAQQEFPLTKEAVMEACALFGQPRKLTARSPHNLVEDALNFWYRGGLGEKDYQVLTVGQNAVVAGFTRSTIVPFSNSRLLDQVVSGLQTKYGEDVEILADYKFAHSLEKTAVRLIVPESARVIERTGTEDDTWSLGVQIKNSLVGSAQTEINGYLFRWWCTNGAIDTHASSGTWSRRRREGQTDEVYSWARAVVDEVLGGLEPALDAVQASVDEPIQGEANEVLRDVFETFHVPTVTRQSIISNMVEEENLTMYHLAQAITQAANEEDMSEGHRETLMRVGAAVPHAAHDRCESCRRLMV